MSADGWTVKERIEELARTIAQQLGGIIGQLDAIERKLDEKASGVALNELAKDVRGNSARIQTLELAQAGSIAVSRWAKWLVAAVAIPSIGVIATFVWLASGGH